MRVASLIVLVVAILVSIPFGMSLFKAQKYSIAGKCVVITGASYGIGVTMAHELARQNVSKIIVAARSVQKLEGVAAKLRQDHPHVAVRSVATDVSDESSRQNLHSEARTFFGESCTTILVNNAGIEMWKPFMKLTPKDINMQKLGTGHVVNVGSVASKIGGPYQNLYPATKFGLLGFSLSMRLEMQFEQRDVSFHTICPGFIRDVGMANDVLTKEPKYEKALHALYGSSAPQESADALVHVIQYDVPEMIVNSKPVRILTTLTEIFPRFIESLPIPPDVLEFFQSLDKY